MPARSFSSESYRYGFNGQEKLDEISGNGNSYDLGARIYNPRLGKMFSPDPREKEYPWQSTYTYFSNSPIWKLDYNGKGDSDSGGVPAKKQEDGTYTPAQSSTYIPPAKEEIKPIKLTDEAINIRDYIERKTEQKERAGEIKRTPSAYEEAYANSSEYDKGTSGNVVVQTTFVAGTAAVAYPIAGYYVSTIEVGTASKVLAIGVGIVDGVLKSVSKAPNDAPPLFSNPYSEIASGYTEIFYNILNEDRKGK